MYDWGVHFISGSVDFLASFSFQRTDVFGFRVMESIERMHRGGKERQEDPSTAAQPDRKENNKLFWDAQQFWCLNKTPLGQLHDLSSSLHPVHTLTPYAVLVPIVTAFLSSPVNTLTVLVLKDSSSGFLMAPVPLGLSGRSLSLLINLFFN